MLATDLTMPVLRPRLLLPSFVLLLAGCPGDPPTGGGGSDSSGTTAEAPASTGAVSNTSGVDSTGEVISDECCMPHSNPGCGNPITTQCVCEQQASCCAFAWEDSCVTLAEACGCDPPVGDSTTGEDPTAGPEACCMPSMGPGCPDPGVESCVCGIDPFCCEMQWDGKCVGIADGQCGAGCTTFGGDCCADNGSPGCDDPALTDCVCAIDPFCCEETWDGMCVSAAQYGCDQDCGLPPPGGDCCMPHDTPQCDDAMVNDCVCAVDDSCCLSPWDEQCTTVAVSLCDITCEGVDPVHPCCFPSPMAGCEDPGLEACVCGLDAFCCDTEWDGQCIDEAINDCMLDCTPGAGGGTGGSGTGMAANDCCIDHGMPGCDDPAIEACVCASLPSCCAVGWSAPCVDEANLACMAMCM